MADILTSTLYPSVRAALDVDLTAALLPDATLDLAVYAPAAEALIKSRDPLWATRTGDELDALKLAAIYTCAALLCAALPSLEKESFGKRDYEYTSQRPDPLKLARILRARASAALARATGLTNTPLFFTTAPGDRVRWPESNLPVPLGSTLLGLP